MGLFDPSHKKRILKELAENPGWGVRAEGAWLCPYCGEIGVKGATQGEALAEAVEKHFTGGCPEWEEFRGETVPRATLEERARAIELALRVRRQVRDNPLWQLFDLSRRWYCPFCAQATDAVAPEGEERFPRPVLERVERHLASCFGFEKGRGKEKAAPYLRAAVQYANRARRLAEQVRRRIETDAAWRAKDADSHWVCPFCKRAIEHIDISSNLLLFETAPHQIAKHLAGACNKFVEAEASERKRLLALQAQREAQRAAREAGAAGTASTWGTGSGSGSGEIPTEMLASASSVLLPPVAGGAPAADPGSGAAKGARDQARKEMKEGIRRDLETVKTQVSQSGKFAAIRGDGAAAVGLSPEAGSPAAHLPPLPEVEGFELRCLYRPGAGPSGDFYDFLDAGDGRLAVAVGHVAGPGREPGIATAICRNLLRIHTPGQRSAAEVLRRANKDSFADLDRQCFVALFLAILEPGGRRMTCARAGLVPPVLYNPAREEPLALLDPQGMVLGVDRGPAFDQATEERAVSLRPGDLLCLFTKGLVEAKGPDAQELGLPRLNHLIRRYGSHEAEYLVDKVGQHLDDLLCLGRPEADAILLAIKVLG